MSPMRTERRFTAFSSSMYRVVMKHSLLLQSHIGADCQKFIRMAFLRDVACVGQAACLGKFVLIIIAAKFGSM